MADNALPLVAVCQLNCTSDRMKNFEKCKELIEKASRYHAKVTGFLSLIILN